MNVMDIPELIDRVTEICKRNGVKRLDLFGSFSTEKFKDIIQIYYPLFEKFRDKAESYYCRKEAYVCFMFNRIAAEYQNAGISSHCENEEFRHFFHVFYT